MNEGLIELGLLDAADQDSASGLAFLATRLLALISETVVESDTLNTDEFRARVERHRQRLESRTDSDSNITLVANDCLSLCQDYLRRARTYLLERESEFAEVINLMQVAIGKLAGEAKAFNVQLMGSTERFNRLTDIQDIRELKKRISQEVHSLNRVVAEKQKQDELNYARLSKRIEILQANLNHTKEQASTDPLTRIPNRGSLDHALELWIGDHRESCKPFVLAMLDIDNFKQINDTHGHQVGDRVLFCAAQWLRKTVRSTDFLARYGGEEFVVMLRDVALPQAEAKFADLLAHIAKSSYAYKKGDEECAVRFTSSCGLAEFDLEESGEDLLRRADEALYVAKRTGKNRVVLAKTQKSLWKTLTSWTSPTIKQQS
jgi:diguanylate cyclase